MRLVLDTNVALDLLVFEDPRTSYVREVLEGGGDWIAAAAMRDEFAAVLAYPNIVHRLARSQRDAAEVLSRFDAMARIVPDAPPTLGLHCTDRDDQKFIDLAVAHGATLVSKDKAVLKLRRRLAARGIVVLSELRRTDPPAPSASTS